VVGQLQNWNPLGYGFVFLRTGEIYFLHGSEVVEGLDKARVGAMVTFDHADPLVGKKHPRAINAVVGGAK